jgi:hypothetical protein
MRTIARLIAELGADQWIEVGMLDESAPHRGQREKEARRYIEHLRVEAADG